MPAAAVIRRVRALSGFTGCKVYRRRFIKYVVKAPGLTGERRRKLVDLRVFGSAGIHGVGVKSVDTMKNTKGEGRHLGHF